MKFSKRFRIVTAALGGGIVVASSACSVDSLDRATAPSSFTPSVASLSRGPGQFGTSSATFPDMSQPGTYNVSVDPLTSTTLNFGASKLVLPANAICAVGTSSYGPEFWNAPCDLQTARVQLTISVTSTSLGNAVDFSPNLRFDPQTNVQLTLSAPQVQKQDAKNWVILYCANGTGTTSGNGSGGSGSGKDGSKCVNESLTDKDLQTFVDYDLQQLTRRIKHFSRYTISDGGWLGSD
jgi:hypothetical protein